MVYAIAMFTLSPDDRFVVMLTLAAATVLSLVIGFAFNKKDRF